MKTVFLSIVLLASTFFAKAQTVSLNIQNATPCNVYFVLYAGTCGNPQMVVTSKVLTAPAGGNYVLPIGGIAWTGPLPAGAGIIGMRVYSDDPATCSTATSFNAFAPTSGPLPAIGGPLFPSCSPCPPFQTFIETYCSNASNIFRFF